MDLCRYYKESSKLVIILDYSSRSNIYPVNTENYDSKWKSSYYYW